MIKEIEKLVSFFPEFIEDRTDQDEVILYYESGICDIEFHINRTNVMYFIWSDRFHAQGSFRTKDIDFALTIYHMAISQNNCETL